MQRLIFIVIIFVLWFILGAGAGFKVLQGVSTDLVLEAFDTSAQGFTTAYSGSAIQATIDAQKEKLEQQIKASIFEYIKAKLGM